jgi:hypothetical protein
VAVGTPNRVQKLLEEGCLNASSIVLDYNFRNEKRQRMMDEKATKLQLGEFMNYFQSFEKRENTKLLIY